MAAIDLRAGDQSQATSGQKTVATLTAGGPRVAAPVPAASAPPAVASRPSPAATTSVGVFDLTCFFEGHTAAYGIFEDRFGRIRRRFDALFIGRWTGDDFVLNETFTFDDGEVDTRIWRLRRAVNGRFTATTEDCIGDARCEASGLATRMRYNFRLKMKARVLPVSLDDRIYRIDERRALNRCTVSKWGIKLGELSIFLEKVDRS
jgi:hypothetical protein